MAHSNNQQAAETSGKKSATHPLHGNQINYFIHKVNDFISITLRYKDQFTSMHFKAIKQKAKKLGLAFT